MPALAVRFVFDRLFLVEYPCAMMLCPDGTYDLAYGAHGGNSRGEVPTPYAGADDADNLDFAFVPIDSYVDVCANLRHEFDAICKL